MTTLRICVVVVILATAVGGAAWDWNRRQEIIRLRAMTPDPGAHLKDRRLLNETLARIQKLQEIQAEIKARRSRRDSTPTASILTERPALPAAAPANKVDPNPEIAVELRNLAKLEATATLDHGYTPLFRTLVRDANATPSQLDGVKALLVQRQQVLYDPASSQNDPTDASGTRRVISLEVVSNAFARIDEQIKQTLGDAGYSLYLHYQQTLPQRNTVELVAQTLDYNVVPLNPSQTEQLVSVLAQFPAQREGATPAGKDLAVFFSTPTSLGTIADEAIKAASSLLSPDQLQALRQVQMQQQAEGKLKAWLGRLQSPAKTAGGTTP